MTYLAFSTKQLGTQPSWPIRFLDRLATNVPYEPKQPDKYINNYKASSMLSEQHLAGGSLLGFALETGENVALERDWKGQGFGKRSCGRLIGCSLAKGEPSDDSLSYWPPYSKQTLWRMTLQYVKRQFAEARNAAGVSYSFDLSIFSKYIFHIQPSVILSYRFLWLADCIFVTTM